MNLIQLKTKEVLKYPSGCHANGVHMEVRYVAYFFDPLEPSYLYEVYTIQHTEDTCIKILLLWSWQPNYHSNKVIG